MVGKYLLKKTAQRFFSKEFLNRPKRGFEVPIKTWFANELRSELEERLLDPSSSMSELFELNHIRDLISEHASLGNQTARLWSLVFLNEWFAQQTRSVALTN